MTDIINSRVEVTAAMAGRPLALIVAGKPTIINPKDENDELIPSKLNPELPMEKMIFNLKANSQVAINNARNQAILDAAIAAEDSGDKVLCDKLCREYMNKVQFSAGVLLPNPLADSITTGMVLQGVVQLLINEKDRSKQLLKWQDGTISTPPPVKAEKTKFDPRAKRPIAGTTLVVEEPKAETEVEPTPVPAGETGAQKKKRIQADIARGVKPESIKGYVVPA